MKSQRYNLRLVHRYFSDIRKWIIILAVVFGVAYPVSLTNQNTWGKYYVIPLCSLALYMMNIRYYLLWMKAWKDVRKEDIIEDDIIVNSLYLDKHYNFYNNGGVHVGDAHLIMEDTDGNRYRLCKKEWSYMPCDELAGVRVRVQYLNTSGIVVCMRELPVKRKERIVQNAAGEFRRELKEYFKAS